MSRRAWAYIFSVLAGAVVCFGVALTSADLANTPWLTFIILTGLAALAQLFVAEAPNHVSYAATPIFVFGGLLLLEPWLFILLVVSYHTIEWGKERIWDGHRLKAWYIQPFNVAVEILSGVLARYVYAGLSGTVATSLGLTPVLIGVCAALVFVGVNHVLLGLALMLARGKTWRETGMLTPEAVSSDVILLLLGYVVAVLWQINPWLIVPALSPLVLMYRALQVPALKHEAQTDSKTNLLNPRYFNRRLEAEFERTQRANRPLGLIMADLDYLRNINNTHGHQAGDIVIAGIGRTIANTIREGDFAGRFGGEEFVVVLPETSARAANQVAERLRAAVEATLFDVGADDGPIHVTMSLGVACIPGTAQTTEELVAAADAAVYRAKARGRNCVEEAPEPSPLTPSVYSAGM